MEFIAEISSIHIKVLGFPDVPNWKISEALFPKIETFKQYWLLFPWNYAAKLENTNLEDS